MRKAVSSNVLRFIGLAIPLWILGDASTVKAASMGITFDVPASSDITLGWSGTVEGSNHYSPSNVSGQRIFTAPSSSISGELPVWAFTDVHGSEADYSIQYDASVGAPSTDRTEWTFSPLVDIRPRCVSSFSSCSQITGKLNLNTARFLEREAFEPFKDFFRFTTGQIIKLNPERFKIKPGPYGGGGIRGFLPIDFGVQDIFDRLQRVMLINVFTKVDDFGIPSVGADAFFGRAPGQEDLFETIYEYNNIFCVINTGSPQCPSSFIDTVIAGLVEQENWEFNNDFGYFEPSQPIDLPLIRVRYLTEQPSVSISDESQITFRGVVGTVAEDSGLESVPGPAPVLLPPLFLYYARRIRKRLQVEKRRRPERQILEESDQSNATNW